MGIVAGIDPEAGRLKGYLMLLDDPEQLKALAHPLRFKILRMLSETPLYPKEISKRLGVNEQLIYYHITELKRRGFLKEVSSQKIRGARSVMYGLSSDGYAVLFLEREEKTERGVALPAFFGEIMREGKLVIVLSSPQPHGPYRSRGIDHHLIAQLTFHLGASFGHLRGLEIVLDTNVREETLQENNILLVGGPAVNMITARINSKMPIQFDVSRDNTIVSKLSGKEYYEPEDGVIEVIENPFNPEKKAIVIAGKSYPGTRAVLMALYRDPVSISKPNAYNKRFIAHVVEGVDEDSDGIVDSGMILE